MRSITPWLDYLGCLIEGNKNAHEDINRLQGRFSSNPLWGDGWGWSLFNADQAETSVTKNYKTECLGCHIPARNDDWIYLDGYPVLEATN